MPVEGLPVILECMLNSALQELTLSSFKIESRGKQTVVVLRLTDKKTGHTPDTQIQSAAYRRKCPSQVSRDRRRAEAHRKDCDEKATGQIPGTPSGLFLPTPPSLFYHDDSDHTDSEALTGMFTYENHCPPSSNNCQDEQQINMIQCDTDRQTVTVSYDEDVNDQLHSEELSVIKECDCDDVNGGKSCVATDEVKDYVCDDMNEMKEYDCEGANKRADSETEAESMECIELVNDSASEAKETEITYKDIAECIQKLTNKMDEFHSVMQEMKRCDSERPRAVRKGNPYRDRL